jgi:predicted nucleic acid-binding protein
VSGSVVVDTNVNGHALHQGNHNADLWIAAAAIRWDLPLAAHDAVFIDCPGLDLRTELTP